MLCTNLFYNDHGLLACKTIVDIKHVSAQSPNQTTVDHCLWHKASLNTLHQYAHYVSEVLSLILDPDSLLTCFDPSCSSHLPELDSIASSIVKLC